MERRTGKIRGAFSRMHRALDGWMLDRPPASPAQGHHHGLRYFNFPYFCTMYVCMYGYHIKQSMDQPGKVANPARGQLNRENNIPLSPCVPENLVSRNGFSRPVPRQPAHLHTQAESGCVALRNLELLLIKTGWNVFVRFVAENAGRG